MTSPLTRFDDALEALGLRDRRRQLTGRAGSDFTSNDYLGLAESPELAAAIHEALERGVPVGAGGSRLLRGNHPEHEALEAEAAAYFGTQRSLFFGSGYAANLALFSSLPQAGDLVLYDDLSHASTREGIRAGKATAQGFRHNDVAHAEALIGAWRREGGVGTPWLAVESIYSMDGDRAPLPDLVSLADRHDGFLIIDEAHATGVFGPKGQGLSGLYEGRASVIAVHTCGKAVGAAGALIAANATLIDFIVNRARAFIFATAPSPLMAAAVRRGLHLIAEGQARRDRLQALVGLAARDLKRATGMASSGSQIIPVILGPDSLAVRAATHLQAAGFDCRAIRPPTVPEGSARLRIAITLNVDEAAIAGLMQALGELDLKAAA